jgi:hypothetical protein
METGGNAATLTLASPGPSDSAGYYGVADNGGIAMTTSTASISVLSVEAHITAHPQSVSTNPFVPVTFSVTVVGVGSYQWQKNGVNIGGATASSYTIDSVLEDDDGTFRCVVTNQCAAVTSNAATLEVASADAPNFPLQPIDVEIEPLQQVTFTVSVVGTPTPTLQWMWTGSATGVEREVEGATSATLSFAGRKGDDGLYRVKGTSAAGVGFSQHAQLDVRSDGLVGHWTFDEEAGATTVVDSSNQALAAHVRGTASVVGGGLSGNAAYMPGGRSASDAGWIEFDAHAARFAALDRGTIAVWIKWELGQGRSALGAIMAASRSTAVGSEISLLVESQARLSYGWYRDAPTGSGTLGGSPHIGSEWHRT